MDGSALPHFSKGDHFAEKNTFRIHESLLMKEVEKFRKQILSFKMYTLSEGLQIVLQNSVISGGDVFIQLLKMALFLG